ncbi:glycosyltransferase family 4 protein [Fulvivirga sp. 29W222]|uniref:Glycosyltransferase family 4 protein n=1 Tax=Fulvivirga marina TaxID=2494733 RepID=A0A937FUX5_9BACT|nr:glycosyltransferase family 4 protein [Fulvivirga marina]MBL6444765.1 glycosyltransferase family 4 protein [Fulvivirga marina]
MKILQVIQKKQLRGAEIFACQLSEELIKLGHEVIVVAIYPGEALLPASNPIVQLNRQLKWRFFDLKGWRLLARLIEEFKPDLIQANASDTLKFVVFSKMVFGWRFPIVYRNANKMSDFIRSFFSYKFNALLIKQVSLVISVSEACRTDFVQLFNIDADKVQTGTIGVNIASIGNCSKDLEFIFEKGPVLINIGSLVPEKNHKGLLNIFSRLHRAHKGIQLIILGTGNEKGVLVERVKQLGLQNNVHFLGSRTDVMEILKKADALVMPSNIEGLPGVILEAQYAKVPVVAYNVGGIGEVIVNRVTGFLVEKGDEEGFILSVSEALSNVRLCNEIIENAYENVLNNYDNVLIAKKFVEMYKLL